MKKYIFLLLIFTTQLFSQTKYEFIDSDRLGQRELKIQLPRNYNENLEQFYPLIVTLDGDYLFEVVSGNVDYMSYWDDMPDAIVVGINQESSKEDDLYISDEDYLTIMDDDGETREDLKLPEHPEGYARKIRKEFEAGKELSLMIVKAMGHEQVMNHKEVVEGK